MNRKKWEEIACLTNVIRDCLHAGIEMVDFRNKMVRMKVDSFDDAFPGNEWQKYDEIERKYIDELGILFYCEKGGQ